MTDPNVKERTADKEEKAQPKQPNPSKGAGRKGNVQKPPSEQRGKPDPTQE